MSFKGWPRVRILCDGPEPVDAIAPVIISASRATDIPAFHADWFMGRLKEGHVRWINPFNPRQSQVVSFQRTRVIVFWTKDPLPLIPHLPTIDASGINYYFQFTLNDYEKGRLEPGLRPLAERIDTFRRLSEAIGVERVIWRFDPILLAQRESIENFLERIRPIGDRLKDLTRKLVISFVDIDRYPRVRGRLRCGAVKCRELMPHEMESVARGLEAFNRHWGFELATCAEEIDLERFGIRHNSCVDDALMRRLFAHDEALMTFLGPEDLFIRGRALKDKGQRRACGCIVSKDIGAYGTCRHGCVYCYAMK